MRCRGVEVNAVAGFQRMVPVAVTDLQIPLQKIEELVARMNMRAHLGGLLRGHKLCEIRIELPVGHHVREAFEVVGRVVDSGLRQADPLRAAMYPEQRMWFGFKEVRQVSAEDHRNPRQIAQRRNNAASLQLREEAGR